MTVIYSSEKGYLGPKKPVKVHLEKKGRGGKTVSVISNIPSKDLDLVAKELKSALGTGGSVKDPLIEIQGDKVAAIEAWLVKKGYKK